MPLQEDVRSDINGTILGSPPGLLEFLDQSGREGTFCVKMAQGHHRSPSGEIFRQSSGDLRLMSSPDHNVQIVRSGQAGPEKLQRSVRYEPAEPSALAEQRRQAKQPALTAYRHESKRSIT